MNSLYIGDFQDSVWLVSVCVFSWVGCCVCARFRFFYFTYYRTFPLCSVEYITHTAHYHSSILPFLFFFFLLYHFFNFDKIRPIVFLGHDGWEALLFSRNYKTKKNWNSHLLLYTGAVKLDEIWSDLILYFRFSFFYVFGASFTEFRLLFESAWTGWSIFIGETLKYPSRQ